MLEENPRTGPPGITPYPLGEQEFDHQVGRQARVIAYDVEEDGRREEPEQGQDRTQFNYTFTK